MKTLLNTVLGVLLIFIVLSWFHVEDFYNESLAHIVLSIVYDPGDCVEIILTGNFESGMFNGVYEDSAVVFVCYALHKDFIGNESPYAQGE